MSILFEHYKQLGKIVNERICSMGRKLGKWSSNACDVESCYLNLRCIN